MKLPFSRKKDSTAGAPAMPPEVENYYQSEHRERTGIAWLLAIGTLVVTVAVVLGLFMGGRWIYRKARNQDKGNTVATTQTKSSSNTNTSNGSSTTSNGSSNSSSSNTSSNNTPSSTGSSSSTTSSGTTSTSTPSTGTVQAPTNTGSTTQTTSPTQTSQNGLPSTGPGDTLAIFTITTIVGAFVHHRFFRTRTR
ncbi:MAG TPA: hypothetical protein VLF87_00180 [Patescibacteria group bacterium]|nr:hypothetical protein [Patescibacteria group bacterium]